MIQPLRQLIGYCAPRIITPITSSSCHGPFGQRYDPSSVEVTRPTPLIHYTGERDSAYLYGKFSSPHLRCPHNFSNDTVDSRLTGIGLSGTTPQKRKLRLRPLDRILLNPSYCIGLVQATLSPARLQLDCSEDVDEEAVEQWINEDSTLECCAVLSDYDIVSRVSCGSEKNKKFRRMF
ncbi:hypothetical protein AVEN_175686-1 [Araneus ventricosus]|uniref:Uncharacterized protein n=1 Tax=Araneus ventricosus TaxID=182803 RepID=A0A4Y2EX97_ARAVE|nr:hypothetical protein AVEN_175686-1 [Araneus ventricosus]